MRVLHILVISNVYSGTLYVGIIMNEKNNDYYETLYVGIVKNENQWLLSKPYMWVLQWM